MLLSGLERVKNMANKTNKKGGFALTPIKLSEPVKATDGFTNLVETGAAQEDAKTVKPQAKKKSKAIETKKREIKQQVSKNQNEPPEKVNSKDAERGETAGTGAVNSVAGKEKTNESSLTTNELLRILGADSLDEIYELTDVLRASSLKLYTTLVRLADSRGRARVKNHELMSKAGIKGIATLYKQERWLMDLKLLEKKAKPGPHDGSSYVVYKLETLPLPAEIFEKFADYLAEFEPL